MARRRGGGSGGGGPVREILSTIAVLIMVSIAMVALVSSGGWSALSEAIGIGDSDARTSELTADKGETPRRSDALPLPAWLASIFGVPSGSSSSSTPSTSTPSTPVVPSTPSSPAMPGQSGQAGDSSSGVVATGSVADWRAALAATDSIPVRKARPGGYDREAEFGGWASSGCGSATTRDRILARDMKDVRKDGKCRVTSGTLNDPYTGKTIAFKRGRSTSAAVQIDHVVALQDAWASGARDWSQEKRVEYANSPGVLLASDGDANMAKGAGLDYSGTSRWLTQGTGAPDIWMPDNKAYRCEYMSRRASIKAKWGLSMTAREKQQTVTFLAKCVAGKE